MAKKKITKSERAAKAAETPSTGGGWHALRETIESIVIAFVLAFLFRTFEAEAFVIPTGSMSPSLLGQHKDVWCSECNYRFRTTASSEGEDRDQMIAQRKYPGTTFGERQALTYKIAGLEVIAGTCPMCRQTMAFRTDLPPSPPEYINLDGVEEMTSYPGDRILVNKYCYWKNDPQRWDVVVFKFPGNGEMNYIKRMIGLPEEELQIYQGDIFIRPLGEGGDFQIQRKPPEKQLVMLQPVHDTDFASKTLFEAGWPLRWSPSTPEGWLVEAEANDEVVDQEFLFDASDVEDEQVSWLRYRHFVPDAHDWAVAREYSKTGEFRGQSQEEWLAEARPQLIRDFNAYNARILRKDVLEDGWAMHERNFGMHWVSDLAIECDVEVKQARGELLLDLVEGGKHFTCRIDLSTGEATLEIEGFDSFNPTASTPIRKTGNYEVLFANVDDQLLLWIDGDLVDFGPTTYDADEVFGAREDILPQTSADDPGDLAPVGIGARGADLTVNRLQVHRDIYYVATSWRDHPNLTDYQPMASAFNLPNGDRIPALQSAKQLFVDPAAWPRFSKRQKETFEIQEDQFFVMGDNSPESQDSRLWLRSSSSKGIPGGPYLDRRLLTGKAVCVFWPHSWGSIPGIEKLPGFPNFKDMRIVR